MNLRKPEYLLLILALISSAVLSETVSYVCNYPFYSDLEGIHQSKEKFELVFIVDRETNKSYMLGNVGTTELIKIENKEKIGFVEVTDTGNIMTTAINLKLDSVHSRNTIILGDLVPSQYYGTCKVR